jgi:uncharacterized C2H2 Zn-finger protein
LTQPKPEFICPECSRTFVSRTGMASHRRSAHGIAGSSTSSIWKAKNKGLPPEPKGPKKCPDCGFVAKDKAGLTIHRKARHGAASESATAVAIRASHPLQCPECVFIAKMIGGLKLHLRKTHGIIPPVSRDTELKRLERQQRKQKGLTIEEPQAVTTVAVTSNGHQATWEGHTDGIPEALIAVASGRFQELCRSMAYEHDVPPRLFASRVAAFVYGTTVR